MIGGRETSLLVRANRRVSREGPSRIFRDIRFLLGFFGEDMVT